MVDYHLGRQINGRPTLRDAYKKSSNRGLRRDKEDTLGSREMLSLLTRTLLINNLGTCIWMTSKDQKEIYIVHH